MIHIAQLLSLPPSRLGLNLPLFIQQAALTAIIAWKQISAIGLRENELCDKIIPDANLAKAEYDILVQLQHTHIAVVNRNLSKPAQGLLVFPQYSLIGEGTHASTHLNFFREIYSALVYSHEKGIFHRDVSPKNIMKNGNRSVLIDWGLATNENNDKAPQMAGTIFHFSLGQLKYLSDFHSGKHLATGSPPLPPLSRSDFEGLFSTLVYWISKGNGRWRKNFLMEKQSQIAEMLKGIFINKATFFLGEGLKQLSDDTNLPQVLIIRNALYPKNLAAKHRSFTSDNYLEEDDIEHIEWD